MNHEVQERQMNPFGSAPVAARPSNAVANTDQQRAVAEVQAAMMIARMNPRDPIAAMDRILNACARPTLADAAVYTYSRGGSDVSGPSIRLAEAMAQSWGNMQFGIRELEQRMADQEYAAANRTQPEPEPAYAPQQTAAASAPVEPVVVAPPLAPMVSPAPEAPVMEAPVPSAPVMPARRSLSSRTTVRSRHSSRQYSTSPGSPSLLPATFLTPSKWPRQRNSNWF